MQITSKNFVISILIVSPILFMKYLPFFSCDMVLLIHTDLNKKRTKSEIFAWNINDPPVVIFNIIEDLEIIAEAAQNEKIDTQLVNYGIDIFWDTNEFEARFLTWFARPVGDRTWANFKTHFTTAHT